MPSTVTAGPINDNTRVREAVCIHTKKIFDSCRDKDCVEDVRVCLTPCAVPIVNAATDVRPKTAELLCVMTDVNELTFNRGFYTVDVRFFYRITGEALAPLLPSQEFTGFAMFKKRVMLFGSEGNAKVFSSDTCVPCCPRSSRMPIAVVEAVDPLLLSMTLVETTAEDAETFEIPQEIVQQFPGGLSFDCPQKRVLVTLGQFSIIRLERDTQLLIPTYDYCMPERECVGGSDDDPCTLFSRIGFPVDEFFPPDTMSNPECYRDAAASFNK